MAERPSPCLTAIRIKAWYGRREILHGVNLTVGHSEVVALLGHNGAGKSTLLKSMFGLTHWEGELRFQDRRIENSMPHLLIEQGIAYVPQGGRIFGELSVEENLKIASVNKKADQRLAMSRILALFPALGSRMGQRASTLSGGERQMLALSLALVVLPKLLLVDEPSLGLAPQLVTSVLESIRRMSREFGTAVLIVEQKVREVLRIADYAYVLRGGQTCFENSAHTIDPEALRAIFV